MPTYRNNSAVPLSLHHGEGFVTLAPGGTVDVATEVAPRARDQKGNIVVLEKVSGPAPQVKASPKKEAKTTKKRRWGK